MCIVTARAEGVRRLRRRHVAPHHMSMFTHTPNLHASIVPTKIA